MTHWFWLAFEDEAAPAGTRARGAVILDSDSDEEIVVLAMAHEAIQAGRLPSALLHHTVHLAEIDPQYGPPRALWIGRHLANDEALVIAEAWTGGVATRAQIRDAFADDTAARGDPLFRSPWIVRGGG